VVLRLRRWSRAISVVLVLAAMPGLSHLAADDAACLSAVETFEHHDHSKHAFRTGELPHHDHCAICHWSRSLRAPRTGIAVWARHVPASFAIPSPSAAPRLAPVLEHTPARAPPAVLL
jgi:hypothetical protein